MYINGPFWSRLRVRILLYCAHANEFRKANYHMYKNLLIGRHYERGLLGFFVALYLVVCAYGKKLFAVNTP